MISVVDRYRLSRQSGRLSLSCWGTPYFRCTLRYDRKMVSDMITLIADFSDLIVFVC
jgi:hypothetical protein